jgi:diguanylate cyclase (GGDEF)-like protein/PAS domain S-box-containing protein
MPPSVAERGMTTTANVQYDTSLQRFRAAMDMSLDLIYLVDAETLEFLDVNQTACRSSGLSREQLLAQGPMKLLGMSREELRQRYQQLVDQGGASRIEREYLHPEKGTLVTMEIRSRATRIDGRWVVIGISRDITDRKKAEQQALRLQQLFSALSLTNEAILRATSVKSLYQQACKAAVSSELFAIASVLVPNARGHFAAEANAGNVLPIMKKIRVSADPRVPEGRGMTALSFRDGKARFSNDFQNDERSAPWREQAIEHGIHSAAALPLLQHKKPVAVMLFYSTEPGFFDEQVQSILQSMADNMSFALENFANQSEQQIAAEIIRQNEERFRSLTKLSSDSYWEMNADLCFTLYEGRIVTGSMAHDHTGIGKRLWELPGIKPDSMNWRQFRRMLKNGQAFSDFEFSLTMPSGLHYHLTLSGEPILDSHGKFAGYRGITRDITSKKRIANHIKHLATHDTLTGLPNRVMFSELLAQTIRSATRYKDQRFAVLFIDLDRFKAVNDTYGHHTGDHLLAEVAQRLRNPLRKSDIVARLGGDEFVVLLQKISDRDQAARIASNILHVFTQPITVDQREFLIGASIGISLFGEDAHDEETLMTHADTAMYAAKEEGRNNVRLYSAELHQHRELRAGLAVELRHALKRNELYLNYQAKVEVSSGRVIGVEALLRWHHPTLGDISPARFVPIAEDNGLIVPIGEWVMTTACRQVQAWERSGLPSLTLAVNLSARQFNHPDLPAFVRKLLHNTGFPAEQLELEITESLVVQNPERSINLMQDLKRTGLRFALDDFGTGYSSLGQLRHYPIDILKIDRAFVHDLENSLQDQAIAKAIISMGKTLGLTVVAEGVENERQLNFLSECECDQIQGFIYHHPVTAEEFARWFQQQQPLKRSSI